MDIPPIDIAAMQSAYLSDTQRPDAGQAKVEAEAMLFETLLQASGMFSETSSQSSAMGMGLYERFMIKQLAMQLAQEHQQVYGRALLDDLVDETQLK